jgi:hypothetical protein
MPPAEEVTAQSANGGHWIFRDHEVQTCVSRTFAMAQEMNDHLATAIARHPDRLAGFVSLPDFKFGPGGYAIAGHQTCSDAPQPSHRHSDLPPVSTMVFTKVRRCAIARALRLGQRSETPRHN